jgi:hypothetical protein
MSDAYRALAKREKQQAENLAVRAHAVGKSALSASLVMVSQRLVKILMKDEGRGRISEPAADLVALRTDPMFLQVKQADLSLAESLAKKTLLAALREGYEYDARERAKVIESESVGLSINVELTEQELADLENFPVSGLTCAEWALRCRRLLSDAVDQALSKPLTGAISPAAIPGLLSAAATTHANGLSSLTKEAYFAGGKAAMLALREAFSGH